MVPRDSRGREPVASVPSGIVATCTRNIGSHEATLVCRNLGIDIPPTNIGHCESAPPGVELCLVIFISSLFQGRDLDWAEWALDFFPDSPP